MGILNDLSKRAQEYAGIAVDKRQGIWPRWPPTRPRT